MIPRPLPSAFDGLGFWRAQAPQRIALVERRRDARWSYAEMDREADRWAGLLLRAGAGRGDRVATLASTRAEQVFLLYACARTGAVLVPLNWRLPAAELTPILADAAPCLVFGEAGFRATAEAALADATRGAAPAPRWIDLDAEAPSLLRDAGPVRTAVAAEDALMVLYTSGSTGRPKGAVLSHRQVHYNAVATTTAWELTHRDVAPVTTPLFHTGGWNVFATPLWLRGGRVILFDRFDADDLLAGLRDEACTVALTVPTQLLGLTESSAWGEPLPALREFVSGGAPCPAPLAERVRAAGYGFREGYGLTECGPNCFSSRAETSVEQPGSVGWPVPFLEMRLAREDGSEVGVDEPGELLLRGPQLFSGYLNQPEASAEAFTSDGWLRTGDLARRDAAGLVSICGRRKEMFISGGENVFPAEVEAALGGHPAVAEVVVVGVTDARWGEVGRAFVVPRPGAAPQEAEILAFARERLAGYKIPRRVLLVPEIPRLGSGKADRRGLAAMEG
jgi:fatty-acyl-CoA synthase